MCIRPALREGDRYLALLALALLGYALLGKGFAYIGVQPIYVVEFALAGDTVAMTLWSLLGFGIGLMIIYCAGAANQTWSPDR